MYTHRNLLCFVKKEMLKTINQCTTVYDEMSQLKDELGIREFEQRMQDSFHYTEEAVKTTQMQQQVTQAPYLATLITAVHTSPLHTDAPTPAPHVYRT